MDTRAVSSLGLLHTNWYISFNSLRYMLRKEIAGYIISLFIIWVTSNNFPKWLHCFTVPPTTDHGSNSHQYLVLPVFFMSAILVESSDYLVVLFICISLITEALHLLIGRIAISISSLEKYQLEVFAQLLIGLFIFIWASLWLSW